MPARKTAALTDTDTHRVLAPLVAAPDIDPTASVHPTARVEAGVRIGARTAVWDHVHIRHDTSIGEDCIVGEKSVISYGVRVGRRCKINSMASICTAVTIEDGVMISAGVVFTNDRFPRAATPDLLKLNTSDPTGETRPTLVREGATIGANATVGNGLTVGRFAMVGMGSLVTKSVPDFALVVGHAAEVVGTVCRCGQLVARHKPLAKGDTLPDARLRCEACGREYDRAAGAITEPTAIRRKAR